MDWVSIYTLDAENVPDLAGVSLLENHDISFWIMMLKAFWSVMMLEIHAVSH